MAYTQDEITAIVNKLLLSNVSYNIDLATNNRQVSATFDDIQESAATLYVLFPAASLYTAALSIKTINTGIADYVTQLTDLIADVQNLLRTPVQVTDLSTLAGMQSALSELGGVVGSGTNKNLSAIPAYQRFTKNAANFLAAAKPSVVSAGDVVPTTQQSMQNIPSELAALPPAFATLAQNIRYFANGMGDFAALNLPTVLSQNVVSRAYQLLATRYSSMSAMSDYDKQTALRAAVLEVIASDGIMASLASFSAPALYLTPSGTLRPYADATHMLLTPGTVNSLAGPFIIRYGVNDTLVVAVDSPATTFTITLNSVVDTHLDGFIASPFNIRSTAAPATVTGTSAGPFVLPIPTTFNLLLECPTNSGYKSWRVNVAVPGGYTWNTDAFADLVNANIVSTLGSALFVAFSGAPVTDLSVTSANAGAGQHIVVLDGTANSIVGFNNGQAAFGTDPNNMLYFAYSASSTATPVTFSVTLPSGYQVAAAVVDTINAAIPVALTGMLHAEVLSAATGAVSQQFVRIVLDDTTATASLTVSGSSDPGSAAASAVGLRGTIGHQTQTPQMLADFLNQYADSQYRFPDYAVASVSNGLLQIQSRGVLSTGSQVAVSGTAATTLFGAPVTGYGSSQWYLMSAANAMISEGDIVEFHDTAVTTSNVLSVAANNTLYLTVAFSFDKTYTFGTAGSQYAVVKQGGQASYAAVVGNAALVKFLGDSHATFFSNLSRYTNMMLVDKNPSETEINTVASLLQSHLAEIQTVSALLATFTAPTCPAVDQLFRQLQEKGADQAVDILTQCRFSDFFGLNVQTSSYTGAVMSGLQTVVQQDLPVSKYDRVKGARQVLTTTQSPDYDSDFSDAQPDLQKYTSDRT